jgi:hypothetical protein
MFYKGRNLGPATINRGTSIGFGFVRILSGIIFYFYLALGKNAC